MVLGTHRYSDLVPSKKCIPGCSTLALHGSFQQF